MTDEAPVGDTNDGETWVTVLFGPEKRAPGIDDASGTTYRDPHQERRRRPFLIGGAIVLGVVAIVGAIAFWGGTSGESAGRAKRRDPNPSHRTSTTASSSTTTTRVAPSTTAPTTPTTTAPAPTAATTATITAPPPTPRATADPASPKYQPEPLPAGVGATLTGCSWQPTGSGRYEASGTLTNGPSTVHGWTITIHWLQDGHEVGQQRAVVNPGPGGSTPWALSLGAPTPPADPFFCALSVA